MAAGYPSAAARLVAAKSRLGARGLEIAVERDPTFRERYDELGLRQLLRDTQILVERIARSVASDDPYFVKEFADWVAPQYRRRRVPMDDVVAIAEGLRAAVATLLSPEEQASADRAIDAGIEVLRWYRRLAGDARKRNPILWAIYKGG